ncbi:MAG: TIR domain-containing protein [Kaiparowitsia implicata GSE-PSE-MK54-09C]|jgi:hypothetical protein|nr:TIR domain-containing protein [Kaiparowitsia implicata GSE-PSE-MK54-09C]
MYNVLVLAANPQYTSRLALDREVRSIDEGLRRSKQREKFVLHQRWAVRPRDIYRALLDVNPQIVHFSGHGKESGLVFEDELGNPKDVSGMVLADLFKLFSDQVHCVLVNCVLANGCYSAMQAEAIAKHVKYVIGMEEEVNDHASIEFVTGFYDALGSGQSVEFSFEVGRAAVGLSGFKKEFKARLFIGKDQSIPFINAGDLALNPVAPSNLHSLASNGVSNQPIKAFLSYSHEDEDLRNQIVLHLSALKRRGLIDEWHDRKISAGSEWKNALIDHMESAQIILLLISADFLASDYCYQIEMKRALERHDQGDAVVIPIVLRPVDLFGLPFNKLKCLPKDGRPATTWENKDEAFLDIAEGIRIIVEDFRSRIKTPETLVD